MEKFNEGDVVYHKATLKRCVIFKKNGDDTFQVRDADDKEHTYKAVELYTQEEHRSRNSGAVVHRNPMY